MKVPGLANDEIGPLDDDDGDEEGGVAGVLELLALVVSPLLTVRVFEIVHAERVPSAAKAEKFGRKESVLGQDDEVGEESGGSLDHTDLWKEI